MSICKKIAFLSDFYCFLLNFRQNYFIFKIYFVVRQLALGLLPHYFRQYILLKYHTRLAVPNL